MTQRPKSSIDRPPSHSLKHVNDALAKSGNKAINKLKLLAFNQLKSGDVTLLAATVTDMEILLQKHGEWAGILSTKAQVVVLTFGVIAHGVLTASMHLETDTAAEGMQNKLQAQNTINIPGIEIQYMGWLAHTSKTKTHSSLVVEMSTRQHANLAIQKSIIWDGQVYTCEWYDRTCRIKQCFRCHKYGHIGYQCQAPQQLCSLCAGPHTSKVCPTPEKKRCTACGGGHSTKDPRCNLWKKEIEWVNLAKQQSSRFWPEPLGVQPPSKKQAQTPDTSSQDIEMMDEPRGHSPPCSQETTFAHQATLPESQNIANLLAPNLSKGRQVKQVKQVKQITQAPTGLSRSQFNPEIRKEVQRTNARVALTEVNKENQITTRLNLLDLPVPTLMPLPPDHEVLRKRRASQSLDMTGHNAPKSTAPKHTYTNAQRIILAELDANAEVTSRKSLSSKKKQAEIEALTQNNSTLADSDMDIDELSQDPAYEVQHTKSTRDDDATTENSSITSE